MTKLSSLINPEALMLRLVHFSEGLFAGAVIFLLFWVVAVIIGKILHRMANRTSGSRQDVCKLMAETVKITIYVLGLVCALGTAGVNVSALVASLGLTGFALGFAFKDALSNLLAGALILFYRPFVRGDRILVTAVEGEVTGIDLRYTRLKDGANCFLVPNANLLSNVITIRNAEEEAAIKQTSQD